MNTISTHRHPWSLRWPALLLVAVACSHEPAKDPTTTDVATGETTSEPQPEPGSNCECTPIQKAPPTADCSEADWFCSGSGECSCHTDWVDSAKKAPPGENCMCTGGTPSAPRGDCAEQDWFCNPSGACRCRS
ncbi:MAG TPA: hypothetical protein VMG12_09810 [Polyangiaceae bacterium]|nr:hypothetical protein [Polyangiaceae bacterium]